MGLREIEGANDEVGILLVLGFSEPVPIGWKMLSMLGLLDMEGARDFDGVCEGALLTVGLSEMEGAREKVGTGILLGFWL